MPKPNKGGKRAQVATNARAIENMNEAQLDKEIKKQQAIIEKAQKTRDGLRPDDSFHDAFPLGSGGLSKAQAEKYVAKESEAALNRSTKIKSAIDKQVNAEKKLSVLENAKNKVKGTGKTQKELAQGKKKPAPSTIKWKTTQKQQMVNGSLKPRVIEGGGFRITGKSVLRIYKDGKQVGTAYSLNDAKAFVEKMNK